MKGWQKGVSAVIFIIVIAFLLGCGADAELKLEDEGTVTVETSEPAITTGVDEEEAESAETGSTETKEPTIEPATSAAEHRVNDLAMGPDGILWAATDFGVISWDITDGSYVRHDGGNGLTDERYNVVFVASDGAIWTSGDQCATHDGETWTVLDSCQYATSLVATDDGTVAAAIGGWHGISVYDGNRWYVDRARDDYPRVALAPDGLVWASENNRLYSWDGSRWRQPDSLASNVLPQEGHLVTITQDGLFWINGHWSLYSYDGRDATHYHLEDIPFPIQDCWSGLDGGSDDVAEEPAAFEIWEAAVAPDGILWIATCRGVASFDGERWIVHTSAPPFADTLLWPNTLLAGPGGEVWIGTYNDGILHYDGQAWQQFAMSK